MSPALLSIPKLPLRYAYALHILCKQGEMYSSQLARAIGVNPVCISNMVTSLEPKGLISAQHKEKRQNRLWLTATEQGKESIKGLFA